MSAHSERLKGRSQVNWIISTDRGFVETFTYRAVLLRTEVEVGVVETGTSPYTRSILIVNGVASEADTASVALPTLYTPLES